MTILVTRENFNKLMCNVTVTDVKSKPIIDNETTIGVYSFISKSRDDKISFSELIRTPLYLFRITDYYCYMIVYNNFESDFLSALWYHGNDNWVISKVAPENKVKIAIQTNSINRFLNNFKFLTMTQFEEHYGHPVGFSMIGEKSIREAINNDNFFPFIPQEVLHTAADFIISYDVFYNTTLIEESNMETLRRLKKNSKKYEQLFHNSYKLEPHNFFYAFSRNLYVEESVYYILTSTPNIRQLFEERYNTVISDLPTNYKDFIIGQTY